MNSLSGRLNQEGMSSYKVAVKSNLCIEIANVSFLPLFIFQFQILYDHIVGAYRETFSGNLFSSLDAPS